MSNPIARLAVLLLAAACTSEPVASGQTRPTARPNVVVIITDDQGYGDLGSHGNPKIRTPHLDRLAAESAEFRWFYVSPVCSPTRASLMTGRYNYRTGVVDTYLGRSLMHRDEVTIAEMLSDVGYRTGIFGKWHLGDNYPLRAVDRGFQEALTLNGGGIGQPSDPPGGEHYFDPILFRDGLPVKTKGYVSDVITDAAIQFIRKHRDQPFFSYLAFNAPHTPLEAPERLYRSYREMGLRPEDFPGMDVLGGHPIEKGFDAETTARIYAMVENIDENVGRLLSEIDALELRENTIIMFLTDNGPQQTRYNAGLLQRKGTTHEGGIRVPFFARWPGRFPAGRRISDIAAHIDLAPTLLEACGVAKPARVQFDGVSLFPLLTGAQERLAERTLFFQWHRGDAPEIYRAFAARTPRYKLVQPVGAGEVPSGSWEAAFKLYDMSVDPLETRDIAANQPEIVSQLKAAYATWFRDVTTGRDYSSPARSVIGAPRQNPVRLTRQDWRGPAANWGAKGHGYWEVEIAGAGDYQISARLQPQDTARWARFLLGAVALRQEVSAGAATVIFPAVRLEAGAGRLECYIEREGEAIGVRDVTVSRIGHPPTK